MTILDSSTHSNKGKEATEHALPRRGQSHGQQRQSGDIELVGGPLREIEATGMLQGLPDRREPAAQVAEVQGRDERCELRERPQPDGNQTEIDETAGPEPLVTPAHDHRPRQAVAMHDARQQCADQRAQRVGQQIAEGCNARRQELL